jgi:hypothetical protein
VVCSCEHGNEPTCSMKGRYFLDYLNSYLLLKKDSVPWSEPVSSTMLQQCPSQFVVVYGNRLET